MGVSACREEWIRSISGIVGKAAGTQVYNHKKKPDLRMSDSMCGDRAFMFQMAFPFGKPSLDRLTGGNIFHLLLLGRRCVRSTIYVLA
jgi:hypothetical protein